jgi:hypothetical protein
MVSEQRSASWPHARLASTSLCTYALAAGDRRCSSPAGVIKMCKAGKEGGGEPSAWTRKREREGERREGAYRTKLRQHRFSSSTAKGGEKDRGGMWKAKERIPRSINPSASRGRQVPRRRSMQGKVESRTTALRQTSREWQAGLRGLGITERESQQGQCACAALRASSSASSPFLHAPSERVVPLVSVPRLLLRCESCAPRPSPRSRASCLPCFSGFRRVITAVAVAVAVAAAPRLDRDSPLTRHSLATHASRPT